MLAARDLSEIERRALEITAIIDAKSGPYRAEIVEGIEASWHLVATFPNQELKAVEYLADRGFGVFLPRFEEGAVSPAGFDLSKQLVFPGHLFLFVWDVLLHWRRIRICPGVSRILTDDAKRPVEVAEKDINYIQALQYRLVPGGLPPSRRRRKRYKSRCEVENEAEYVSVTCYSALDDVASLDSVGRNQALHKALGLAS